MLFGHRLGPERRTHQLLENRRRQQSPPLGQRSISNVLASELLHMLSQCARFRYHMKDQALDQFGRADTRWAPKSYYATPQQRSDKGPGNDLLEQRLERGDGDDSFGSPPQGNGTKCPKVQGKSTTLSSAYILTSYYR